MEKPYSLLIIEDDTDMSNMLSMLAELIPNYDIEVISDGRKALKRLDDDKLPTVVLLDLHLPHVEGDEFLRLARENPLWKDVPIYILTAYENRARGYQADLKGASGAFLKGEFSIDEVKDLLEKIAAQAEKRAQLLK